MQIVIDTAQTHVTVKDGCFYISSRITKRQISPKRVSSIAILANVTVNASAMILAAENQVPILYFNSLGEIKAKVYSPYFKNLASLRRSQLLVLNTSFATKLVVTHLQLKIDGQIGLIGNLKTAGIPKRFGLRFKERADQKKVALGELANQSLESCRNTLMGIEGSLSRLYWTIISESLMEEYRFSGRSRRPARDAFNGALNYLYGMTYNLVESAVFAAGLDPFIGYLHTENYLKTSLVFDLIEPIRPLVDGLLVEMCQRKFLKEAHFDVNSSGGYRLSKAGKKLLIPTFNEYLRERIVFNGLKRTFRDHVYFYCHQFAKNLKKMTNDVPNQL